MDICLYYESKNKDIIDILPKNLNSENLNNIQKCWQKRMMREILIILSHQNNLTLSSLAKLVNHSTSTVHDNIKNLEKMNLVSSKISYKTKKQRIICSNILCVTRNPKYKESLKKFFQGLWVNDLQTEKIIKFLQENKDKSFTAEKISLALQIPVDDVRINLSNWDSKATRGISNFNKEVPFEKIIEYRGK